MERVFRASWYLSVIIVFFGLLYSFAALPDNVQYSEAYGAMSRDSYFYSALGIIGLSNFALFSLARKVLKSRNNPLSSVLQSWLYLLNFSLNLFFFTSLIYVMMHNSNEKWNVNLLAYGIYFTIGLIIASIISLPVLLLTRNRS